MARYIDVDAFLENEIKRCGCVPLVGSCTMDNESLAYQLAKAPTADVVEVPYRCETCIRKKGKVNECGDVYCILHKGYFDRDAFCSYGERRTDNDL